MAKLVSAAAPMLAALFLSSFTAVPSFTAATPPGFIACSFIRKDPGCVADSSSKTLAHETAATLGVLDSVNADVNDALAAHECRDDRYDGPDGEPNWWTSYGAAGYYRNACVNCIVYAVTKRRELLTRGFPARAVRFALVHEYGAGNINHVLVLVYTDKHPRNPYVLDSLGAFGNPDVIWHLSDVIGTYRYTLLALQDAHGVWQKPQ